MFRRWFIRAVFILPLLLCLAGWGWSAGHFGESLGSGIYFQPYAYTQTQQVGDSDWEGWGYGSQYHAAWHLPETEARWSTFWGLGLGYDRYDNWYVSIPYWFMFAVSSAVLFFVWRRTGHKKIGQGFPVVMKAKGGKP